MNSIIDFLHQIEGIYSNMLIYRFLSFSIASIMFLYVYLSIYYTIFKYNIIKFSPTEKGVPIYLYEKNKHTHVHMAQTYLKTTHALIDLVYTR